MLKYKLIPVVVLAGLLNACRVPETTTRSIAEAMPKTFNGDSSAAVLPPWQSVFADSGLRTLIDTAIVRNFDVRMAYSKIEAARAAMRLHRGIRLPELQAGVYGGVRRFGDYTMDGVGNYDTRFSPNINDKQMIPQNPLPDYYIGFQSSWEIDLWGKLKNRKKAAADRFIASRYGKDLMLTGLIAEVATAYYELLALEKEAGILKENIVLQQSAMDLVKAQKEAAMANQLAVEMLHAQLLSSKAAETEVQLRILDGRRRLSFLCGTYPDRLPLDSVKDLDKPLLLSGTGLPSALLANRPDIRQAEHELRASKADLKSARLAFYPGLNINPAFGLQSFKAVLLLEMPASIALNAIGGLSAPLLNRRKIKSELIAAGAEHSRAYIQYEKTVVNSFMEVFMALSTISSIQTRLELKQEEVSILRQSVQTSGELFRAGRAGYLDIILAQKNALESQKELNNCLKQRNLAMVELYRSLGGGWK